MIIESLKSPSLIVYSNVYGFARSILAVGTLLTLLFNPTSILFAPSLVSDYALLVGPGKLTLYYLLSPNLEAARIISILVLIVVASGWRPMITGAFHWWITFSFNASASILEGGDQVASVLTLLLLPICLTDTRKWHWDKSPTLQAEESILKHSIFFFSASAFIVIKLQVAYIYFNSGVEKLKVEEWLNGTAVYYWFTNPYMGANNTTQFFLQPLITNSYFTAAMTWGSILFEILLAAALFMSKRYRGILLVAGIGFHFLIAIIHGLIPFFFSMTAALILYLRPVDNEFNFSILRERVSSWYRMRFLKKADPSQ